MVDCRYSWGLLQRGVCAQAQDFQISVYALDSTNVRLIGEATENECLEQVTRWDCFWISVHPVG